MHAAVCLLRAGQPRSAGDAAKLGQFIGQFALVTGDPIGLEVVVAFFIESNAAVYSKIINFPTLKRA